VVSVMTTTPPAIDDSARDLCLPFLINDGAFRGRLIRLTDAATEILNRHNDPEPVAILLAESMVAAAALAGGLKYDGIFTFQIQGRGAVRTLVVDVTSEGDVRGCVKFDDDALAEEMSRPRAEGASPRLLGSGGHLAFTVDQGPDTERYQGIVDLAGESIADTVHHYFRQSEQLDSAIKIAIDPPRGPGGVWSVAGLIIQRMPEEGGARHYDAEDVEDAWRAAIILLGSLTDNELLDPALSPLRLLARVYGTVGARVITARPLAARCRCSAERSERIIASFPAQEIRTFAVDGEVRMTCEFCHECYVFPESELESLIAKHRA
jgi:molecular chaperone Hsp33